MGDTFKNAQDEHMTQLIKVLDEIKLKVKSKSRKNRKNFLGGGKMG